MLFTECTVDGAAKRPDRYLSRVRCCEIGTNSLISSPQPNIGEKQHAVKYIGNASHFSVPSLTVMAEKITMSEGTLVEFRSNLRCLLCQERDRQCAMQPSDQRCFHCFNKNLECIFQRAVILEGPGQTFQWELLSKNDNLTVIYLPRFVEPSRNDTSSAEVANQASVIETEIFNRSRPQMSVLFPCWEIPALTTVLLDSSHQCEVVWCRAVFERKQDLIRHTITVHTVQNSHRGPLLSETQVTTSGWLATECPDKSEHPPVQEKITCWPNTEESSSYHTLHGLGDAFFSNTSGTRERALSRLTEHFIPPSTQCSAISQIKCNQCNVFPGGFRGEHELQRHVERAHATRRKAWVCVDASPGKAMLAGCKDCRSRKLYGAYYNAAAHLRRVHFNPRHRGAQSRSGRAQRRGSISEGTIPPMKALKNWMEEVEVAEILENASPSPASKASSIETLEQTSTGEIHQQNRGTFGPSACTSAGPYNFHDFAPGNDRLAFEERGFDLSSIPWAGVPGYGG